MASNGPPGHLNRPPRWRRVVGAAALTLLVVLPCCGLPTFCLSYPRLMMWWNRVPFDAEAWKAGEDRSARYDMSYHLIYGGLVDGKTAAEVTELLGRPMTTDKRVGYTNSTPIRVYVVETWYYDLGEEKYVLRLGPNGAILAVELTDGKVTRVWRALS
jgi:hypothetical protein